MPEMAAAPQSWRQGLMTAGGQRCTPYLIDHLGFGMAARLLRRIVFRRERLTIGGPDPERLSKKAPSLCKARLYSGSLCWILIAFVKSHVVESLNLVR